MQDMQRLVAINQGRGLALAKTEDEQGNISECRNIAVVDDYTFVAKLSDNRYQIMVIDPIYFERKIVVVGKVVISQDIIDLLQ